MKRFRKVYVEISNICNLNCSFCPGTKREKRAMTEAEFAALLPKLQPWTDYLYFHLKYTSVKGLKWEFCLRIPDNEHSSSSKHI